MEEKGLRYSTERIHLGGDPREPPKQAEYLRDIAPRGNVPALRIREGTILESLDILRALDDEFPDEASAMTRANSDLAERLIESSGAFDTDCDEWLHNTDATREASLRAEAARKLTWLEAALGERGESPFFLGSRRPGLVDAAYVGFLTRLSTNYRHFKSLDLSEPASGYPRLAAWLSAIEQSRGGQATRQEAFFEQRIYQAHPARRMAAEPCMMLHPTRLCIGEPHEHRPPPCEVAPRLSAGSEAALEAAWRLCERREDVANFLLRKHANREVLPARHWKTHARRAPNPPTMPPPPAEEMAFCELHLLALASVLAGTCDVAEGVALAGGAQALRAGAVAGLGALVGTPRDMSVAAAAQLRVGLNKMLAWPS